jgi:ABC-type nitrate/sulfonate/bicarbonate transport system ATPase subunit
MSWKVVVASEVLAIPKYSIGYQMLNSKYYLETADLFAYMIVLIVLSLLMERAVSGLSGMNSRGTGKAVRKAAQKSETLGALPPAPEIRLEGVSKSFITEDGKVSPALKDFSAEFREGVMAVLGPSGEGKTTMARLISGLEEADSGEIRTGDSRIAYLFQEDRLLPWLNVRDNMLLSFVSGKAEGQDPETSVKEMAEKLEISDALNMMPGELSGGMAHRAALGRTLLFRGNLLILDEPFRGLDEELRERIIGRLSEYLGEGGTGRTVILITHDEDLADKLSDKRINI